MDFDPLPQQRRAIEAPLGPVLVVAGPGAGKTACLIGRIEYLTTRADFAADRICAVTFTNKAAEEIAVRLRASLGARADEVTRGTIHALCSGILRDHSEAAGLKAGFGIADDAYRKTLLRQMRQGRRADQLLKLFSRRCLAGYRLTAGDERIYERYTNMLRQRNVVSFDELLLLTARLFEESAELADAVASRWDYLLVDEFQDVNDTQYAILKRLAEPHRNLFAVGDDEQSIFSFAGANPRVLARFRADFGITAPIVLERNHRCSVEIFEVARRLLSGNPSLFDKDLTATRLSPFPVRACSFADDDAEMDWIISDIRADTAEHGLSWGDFAVLYRRHTIGDRLEGGFLTARIPCRLARGRPLSEDKVIGYVIDALRLVKDPHDPVAAERFARRVLPEHLMQRVEAEVTDDGPEFLRTVRDLAGGMRGDPDAKKLWRLVYQAENLATMSRRHAALGALVDELLSQRVGRYTNPLEERHGELLDPADIPAARSLAERLLTARSAHSRVVLERMDGLEIGLRGMLFGAGFRLVLHADEVVQAELDDLRIGSEDAPPGELAVTLFKALQLTHAGRVDGALERYVAFDLETTGIDVATCEVVEIGAVRVEKGRVLETFHTMVRPACAVSADAQRVHGHSEESLAGAPSFAEAWPGFREFVGDSVLVAHNGMRFDVPVLRRMAASVGGDADQLPVFDTYPLARSLSGDSARLEDLAKRFGVELERAHHALEDARALVGVYEALEGQRVVRARKAALVNVLAFLGLSMALESDDHACGDAPVLFDVARIHAMGRYSDCLEQYETERERLGLRGPAPDEVVRRLGGRALMDRLREEVEPAQRYPEAVARLEALTDQLPGEGLAWAVERFLERVALSTSQGADVDEHRVNLLTLHSTKGLEFSRVYIVGVEDEQLPGWISREDDEEEAVQESRRVLYVGMTRARDRLVLTRVDRRGTNQGGGSRFLAEMGLEPERPERKDQE